MARYDYQSLERQFVRAETDISIRELCKQNGIKTWSTVSEYAKRHGWLEKRAQFKQRLEDAETRAVVTSQADKLAKALEDGVMIANQAIYSFFDSLKDRWVTDPQSGESVLIPGQTVSPRDFVAILEKIMVLNGQFTSREARLELNVTAETVTMENMRELLAAARATGADARPIPSSPLPRAEGARSVN